MLILNLSVQAGLHEMFSGKKEYLMWSVCGTILSIAKNLTEHCKATFQQLRSPIIKVLPKLILMFSVQSRLHKMFAGEGEVSEVEQSKWSDYVKLKAVAYTFQGDFPLVAQSENKRPPNVHFNSQCSGRPTQDVCRQKKKYLK